METSYIVLAVGSLWGFAESFPRQFREVRRWEIQFIRLLVLSVTLFSIGTGAAISFAPENPGFIPHAVASLIMATTEVITYNVMSRAINKQSQC